MTNSVNMKKDIFIRLFLLIPVILVIYFFGIKPLFIDKSSKPGRSADNSWASGKLAQDPNQYDVIVLGGEPEGIAAAISASRIGAKTLLISEREDLGGVISHSFVVDTRSSREPKGSYLNKNVLSSILNNPVRSFSVTGYLARVEELVKSVDHLEVLYGGKLDSVVMNNNILTGVNISQQNSASLLYEGKRFVDATRDGKLLEKCKVPYFLGSEDLNLKNSYMPVHLNFEIKGVNWSAVQKLINSDDFLSVLGKYETTQPNLRISDFNASNQGNGQIIIQGIEMSGIDTSNQQTLSENYKKAVMEAKNLAGYLKSNFKEFNDLIFTKAADEFYIQENRHYLGEHQLSVNEILENKDFDNKIALGTNPVLGEKFTAGGGRYTIGKPVQYSIPLGCMVPQKVDNLLMAGSKISYSSLASTSTATLDVNATTGEAAGIVAVYSIVKGNPPRNIAKTKDVQAIDELQEILKKQGMNLPRFSFKNNNASNWSYAAVKQLVFLGLIAGGPSNNYNFDGEAKMPDLPTLLINGVYRLAPEKYTLDLDARLKPYYGKDKLTKETASEILMAFYGARFERPTVYQNACNAGYINKVMELRLKDKKVLTLDDVYYLSAYNVKQFTGKDIGE